MLSLDFAALCLQNALALLPTTTDDGVVYDALPGTPMTTIQVYNLRY